MKKKLTVQEYVVVASMLFGLFFGAGNLIFPVHMGQMAGSQLVPATLGFLITGVGLPLLSVAALGISKSEGLFDLSRKVSRPYAYFFTCLLYLTIGPFFAIPRCATTAFTVGIEQAVPQAAERLRLWLLVFSAVFFAAALLFSLFPGKILTWVGKILNPFFLLFLGILIIVALVKPSAAISAVAPEGVPMPLRRSPRAFWRATTQWTYWQVLPSASSWCRSSGSWALRTRTQSHRVRSRRACSAVF